MSELDIRYHASFKFLQDNIQILPESLEFLEFCRFQQMPIFLLSTIHSQHFEVQGNRLGLTSYFKQAYTQAYDKRKAILQLLEEHGLNADETLFIGDMMHDIEAAKHGGVRSCGVLTGYDSLEKLKRVEPDLIFRDLGQVKRYLERHQRGDIEQPPIATVGGLLFNGQGEVLMVQTYKWSDLWGIPGGKIKRGETTEEALRREIREETALEITDICYLMTQDCIDSKEFYKPAHFLLLNYSAKALSEKVTLNDEADRWKWVDPEDALLMPINQPTRILLEHVISRSSGLPYQSDNLSRSGSKSKILINDLELSVHIGVPEEERAERQKVLATIELETDPFLGAAAQDDIRQTVDYYTLSRGIKELAESKPKKLLETLVEEIVNYTLGLKRVTGVTVKLKKFILPNARYVAVEVSRRK